MNAFEPVQPLFCGYYSASVGISGYSGVSGYSGYLTQVYNRSLKQEKADINAAQLKTASFSLAPVTLPHAEGDAQVTNGAFWTVLSFWDRSMVNETNAFASFLLPGVLNFNTALESAQASFPTVFDRFNYNIVDNVSNFSTFTPTALSERDYGRSAS